MAQNGSFKQMFAKGMIAMQLGGAVALPVQAAEPTHAPLVTERGTQYENPGLYGVVTHSKDLPAGYLNHKSFLELNKARGMVIDGSTVVDARDELDRRHKPDSSTDITVRVKHMSNDIRAEAKQWEKDHPQPPASSPKHAAKQAPKT